MLKLLILSLIVSAIFVCCNYRNSLLLYSNEERDEKAKIKPLYKPLKKGLNWMDWITIIVVLAVLFSCSSSKVITGEIRAINQDTVQVAKHKFKLLKSAPLPLLNTIYTFTPTKDSAKINCIKLK